MEDPERWPGSRLPFRLLPLAQREVALLIVLGVISVVTFAGTARLASWSADRRTNAATHWFTSGEELARAGQADAAIRSLREAVALDRENPAYRLGLARVLADAGRNLEARQLLLQLRQGQPDDVEVNLRLARLAARSDNTAEAMRYYTYAMYGLARIGADFDRPQLRAEFVAFLVGAGERQEATAQLEALSRELPETAAAHLAAARLAVRAGDTSRALEQFIQAGRLDPANVEAAAGAGEAAFALRDFRTAVRELKRAVGLGASGGEPQSQLESARLVLATDPLATGITSGERVRRARAGLARALGRHEACERAMGADLGAADPVRSELKGFQRRPNSELVDPDVLSRLVERVSAVAADRPEPCAGLTDALDRAWILIGDVHRSSGT